MATLLLRLAAPLQAWGSDSKFETRKTDREPTKSGVVGLLAAALGLRRDDTEGLARLNGLRFAVRADQEGSLLVDFHTAKSRDTSYVTYRHYLQDAVFLAGLESEDEALLRELEAALRHPVYPLYLGRRSCPPTLPLCLGIRQGSLLDVLRTEPMQGRKPETGKLRIVADADPADPAAVPGRICRCPSARCTGSTGSDRCGNGGWTGRKCRNRRSTTPWRNCRIEVRCNVFVPRRT